MDSRSRQGGRREELRRSSTQDEHAHPRRHHRRRRRRRIADDEEEDQETVSDHVHSGDDTRSEASVRLRDQSSTTTANTTRRRPSTRSNHQHPETRGLFKRHTASLVDVISRPLVDIVEGGREPSRSFTSSKRPTTRKRHSEPSSRRTDHSRTRYDIHITRGGKILTTIGARPSTKVHHRRLALRLKEATHLREGPLLSPKWRYLRPARKPRM